MESFERIVRRIGSWRAPLVFGAFLLSLPAYALIFMDSDGGWFLNPPEVAPRVYRLIIVGLAVCASSMIITRKESSFRSLLAISFGATLFLVIFYRMRVETVALLTLVIVVWALLYEAHPSGVLFSCAEAIILPAAGLLSCSYSLLTAAALSLACVAPALLGSILMQLREKTIALQRYVNRLEENVASLTRANVLSQDYAKDVEMESRTLERERLTRDIHDTIGYTLTNTVMMMEAIKVMVRTEPERVPDHIKRIRAHIEKGLADVRKILRRFRVVEYEGEPVFWAVKKLVTVFTISTGLKVRYEMGNVDIGDLDRFPGAVYHFIQEGLINAFRHGHASRVIIMFWNYGDYLRILLDDDGTGGTVDSTPGIGIQGMRERAALVGGRVSIDAAENGFRISMYLPIGKENVDENTSSYRR